jgi:hypothetical protein
VPSRLRPAPAVVQSAPACLDGFAVGVAVALVADAVHHGALVHPAPVSVLSKRAGKRNASATPAGRGNDRTRTAKRKITRTDVCIPGRPSRWWTRLASTRRSCAGTRSSLCLGIEETKSTPLLTEYVEHCLFQIELRGLPCLRQTRGSVPSLKPAHSAFSTAVRSSFPAHAQKEAHHNMCISST